MASPLADLAARLFDWTYRDQDDSQGLIAYIQEKPTPAAAAQILTEPNAAVCMAETENGLCRHAHLQLEGTAPQVVAAHTAEMVWTRTGCRAAGGGVGNSDPKVGFAAVVDR